MDGARTIAFAGAIAIVEAPGAQYMVLVAAYPVTVSTMKSAIRADHKASEPRQD